jgi:outer membrane usher protein
MSHPARRSLAAAVLAALLAGAPPSVVAQDAPPAEPIPAKSAAVSLVVAGIDRGIVIVRVGPDDVWVPLAALRATELRLPSAGSRTAGGVEYLSLRSLSPGATYTFDQAMLTVSVFVKDPTLIKGSQDIDVGQRRAETSGTHAEPSGFINYLITGTNASTNDLSAFTEVGFGNEGGHFTATGSYNDDTFHRGLIAYSVDQAAYMRRETVGDEIGDSGALGSSVVIGGIGVSRLFALQPNFVRAPSPSLTGTVLSPTRADIYINGTLYSSLELQPGQFNIGQLPVPPGANVTQVVLHDANGTTTDITAPYYSASTLLPQGVNEYSYHIGFVRPEAFGAVDRYGSLAGLGFFRVGLTDAVSVGATFEGEPGKIDGGPTVDFKLPIGAVSLAGSASDAAGIMGHAALGAYSFASKRLSASVYEIVRSAAFSTITLAALADRTTVETGESVSFSAGQGVTFGVDHTATRYRDAMPTDRIAAIASLRPIRRATLQLSIERDRGVALDPSIVTSRSSSWTIGTTLMLDIGRSTVATVRSATIDGHAATNVELYKQAPEQYGLGYDAQASLGAPDTFRGEATYRSQVIDVDALLNSGDGPASVSTTFSGGIGIFPSGVFFSEPIQSAYGLVHVEGMNDVPVLFNGIELGTTGKRGAFFIPNLAPYVDNTISLGSLDAATNAVPDAFEKPLNPRFDSGVSTVFKIHRVQIFVGKLAIQRNGTQISPSYGIMRITGPAGERHSDLGADGEFYYENLTPGTYRATALYAGNGTCSFDLVVASGTDLQVDLGKLTCIEH